MKKTVSILGVILFVLISLLPIGTLLCTCLDYTFELVNYTAFAVITALGAIITATISIIYKKLINNRFCAILFSLIAPLSFMNSVFYLFECSTVLVILCMLICISSCCYLCIEHGKPLVLKITCIGLSGLMILPICFFTFITLLFGNFGQNTIMKSVISPNGTYYAEVIDSDQGGLGGATFVDVYDNKGFNTCIFKISKPTQRVYSGEWGEKINIYWKDNNCLLINSVEYIIK